MKWLKETVDKIDLTDSKMQLAERCIIFESNLLDFSNVEICNILNFWLC